MSTLGDFMVWIFCIIAHNSIMGSLGYDIHTWQHWATFIAMLVVYCYVSEKNRKK